jgi:N-acetylmuramoyl-L-alanine amidase
MKRGASYSVLLFLSTLACGFAAEDEMKAADAATECRPRDFRIALDVGHTRQSPGARSSRGLGEYDFNLSLAAKIQMQLQADGFSSVAVLISSKSGSAGLKARAATAASFNADVLISIHHDSVQSRFLKQWVPGNKTPQLYSDQYKGYSLFVSYSGLHPSRSLELAQFIGASFLKKGLKFSPHHAEKIAGENREILDFEKGIYRFDNLIILRKAFSPAILIEAGVIVNRDEELELGGENKRRSISEAISDALLAYCIVHPPAASGTRLHSFEELPRPRDKLFRGKRPQL